MYYRILISSLYLVVWCTEFIVLTSGGEKGTPYIIGGSEIKIEDFPWQAMIRSWMHNKWITCGACLLSSKWIMTAAHCLPEGRYEVPIPHLHVAVGLDMKSEIMYNRQEIVAYFRHPDWNYMGNIADIALLKLKKKVKFSKKIQTIVLPNFHEEQNYVGERDRVRVAGFGMVKENGTRSEHLRSVKIEILAENYCVPTPGFNGSSHICAGSLDGSKDACHGDSGGPLIVETERGAVVLGLVSYGEGCGRPNFPGIYTRVSVFVEWINRTMARNDTSHLGE